MTHDEPDELSDSTLPLLSSLSGSNTAALYAGHGPGTVKLFMDLWGADLLRLDSQSIQFCARALFQSQA